MSSKDNQERPERESKLVTFISARISQFEADILQEIETLTKLKFTKFEKIQRDTKMGFTAENNKVTGIGFYAGYRPSDCGLSTLPESIRNLKSLTYLSLSRNKFTTLPESIGNLKTLQTLDLSKNKLTTLPESITKLESLQILALWGNQLSTLPESIKILEKRGVTIYCENEYIR